jgi:hypothetical protein
MHAQFLRPQYCNYSATTNKSNKMTTLSAQTEDLRSALLKLKPTGEKGFEGLLARVLSKISGQDFRLAKSGLQLGKDGETLATTKHVSFEAKLYTGNIPTTEVHGKITQIIGSSAPPDIWVLGATVEAGTQLLEPMQTAAERNGIVILVLDWPTASSIPPLAAACAMASEETRAFLASELADKQIVAKADAALSAIRATPDFEASSKAIRKPLTDPSAGIAIARDANGRWLDTAFSDRRVAKDVFGQVLAPKAAVALPLRARPGLVETVQKHLTTPPPDSIIALIGGDGFGKSWLLAQSWLGLQEKPLLVVVPAVDIKPVAAYGEFLPFLTTKLILQTGDDDTPQVRARWVRRFKCWKELPNSPKPRFVVCVDGLNEQKHVNWSRWLDGAAAVIEQHGGVLVITVRAAYFDDRLRNALNSKVTTVRVPEWTQGELTEILAKEGIDATSIRPNVLARLCNPRILGIAFELRKNVQIQNFAELSVERLLFEHIRIGERDGSLPEAPEEFVKRLAEHAQEIINRVQAQNHEGRLLFDRAREGDGGYELTAEILAVAGENFFKQLPEDLTQYTLSEDGLTLALGFSIIRSLKNVAHGSSDVSEVLERLIEPVAALDKTADAVFAAVLLSSADDRCSSDIRRVLICAFLRLQNIDEANYSPFVSAVRKVPEESLLALAELSLSTLHVAHKDWLSTALRECRVSVECWKIIAAHASKWLRTYSMDSSIAVISTRTHDSADLVSKEAEKKADALKNRHVGLSHAERRFLDEQMLRDDAHDPAILTQEALTLLAGMDLAPFATDLVACSFSHQLNSGLRGPYDEFVALLRFNRKDWNETRAAVRVAASFLYLEDTSRTGKWALVAVLRGLSTAEDATLENQLVEELTQDRESFGAWRLVESYCANDPCDPASTRPENIDDTAEKYRQINLDEVAKNHWMGSEDHFIRDARPGLARFAPETAIETQRKIASSIVLRDPTSIMLGLTSLEAHSAVLSPKTFTKLLDIARELSSPLGPEESREARDCWIGAQYAMQAAFPHLDGNAQLNFLISLPPHGPPLLKLAEIAKAPDAATIEQSLERALTSDDHCRQLVALLFGRIGKQLLTDRSRELVAKLFRSQHSSVRSEAMHVIVRIRDTELIRMVVDSDWNASALDRHKNHYEAWYGSSTIIEGARMGILSSEDALDRIVPELYGHAAQLIGSDAFVSIAARLKQAVAIAIDVTIPFTPPVVEQNAEVDPSRPSHLSLAEPDEVLGPVAFFKRMNESPEDFEARRRQGWEAFSRFQKELSKEKAQIIVENIGIGGVRIFLKGAPQAALDLARSVLSMKERKLMQIQNFALMLAECISASDPLLAKAVFERLGGRRAFVSLTYGYSAVPLEALCIWSSANNPEMDDLRTRRLNAALTDYGISQEVRAALMAQKNDFLDLYVRENLERREPAANARALMVLGFGAQSQTSEDTLARYSNAGGLVGKAYKAARFAYDRDRWSRYWFEKMCNVSSADEFWLASVLFLKVVDSRFSGWEANITRNAIAQSFEPTISDKIKNRIKTWKAKREKSLCGDKTPGEIFVVLD